MNTRLSGSLELPVVTVERRHSSTLDFETFQREYVAANRPVVVEDAVTQWPALHKWTPDFFRTQLGSKRVDVSYQEQMTFVDFIDGVMASREDAPGPYMYRTFIGPHLPELLPDVTPQNAYAFPGRLASPLMPRTWRRPDGYLKLLIGGVGGRFPIMHYDGENMHAAVTEIYGEKVFVLYAPEDGKYLYPRNDYPNKTAIDDIDHPDMERFPLFALATRYQTVLGPGDMVFVPSRWWHTARVLTPSVSVCQNMLNCTNWDGYLAEVHAADAGNALKRQAKRMYLGTLGRLLGLTEKLCRTIPAAITTRLAQLAPASSDQAISADKWPMHEWTID